MNEPTEVLHQERSTALRLWAVNINNGQRQIIVDAPTAGEACSAAETYWRADETITHRQRRKGIYDIRASRAKFGEARSRETVAWQEPEISR